MCAVSSFMTGTPTLWALLHHFVWCILSEATSSWSPVQGSGHLAADGHFNTGSPERDAILG